jgi:cation transport ATPase
VNADVVWMIGLVVTGVPVVWGTLRRFASGHFATDLVAALAVTTSVILQQPLAGLVIVLMQTGGEALERYAEGRASAPFALWRRRRRALRTDCAGETRSSAARRTRSTCRRSRSAIICSCGRAR